MLECVDTTKVPARLSAPLMIGEMRAHSSADSALVVGCWHGGHASWVLAGAEGDGRVRGSRSIGVHLSSQQRSAWSESDEWAGPRQGTRAEGEGEGEDGGGGTSVDVQIQVVDCFEWRRQALCQF
jgi:hypothetical protein